MMRYLLRILSAALLLAIVPIGSAAAQSDSRCFPETGFCISGPIRRYWERNGGLAVFGYPITAQQTETVESVWTGPVQWFERDRLEDHSNQGLGVLAGRLGARYLELDGRPWTFGSGTPTAADCLNFSQQTGYSTCGVFRNYWQKNGGLERFGYPITDVQLETIEGRNYQVQYFERRRMEYHPENAGTPYEILLGLLGKDVRAMSGQTDPTACAYAVLPELRANAIDFSRDAPLGCPVPGQDYSYTQGASARFERGQMYWINLRGGKSVIYALLYGPNSQISYRYYEDTWREGDPVNSGLTPPSGLLEPNRGFGKVWRDHEDLRVAIGWALENEKAETLSYQVFQQGRLLMVPSANIVWQFIGNGDAGSARSSAIKY